MSKSKKNVVDRRNFLKTTAVGGMATLVAGTTGALKTFDFRQVIQLKSGLARRCRLAIGPHERVVCLAN